MIDGNTVIKDRQAPWLWVGVAMYKALFFSGMSLSTRLWTGPEI